MKVGFTGTSHGMTDAQRATVTRLLHGLEPNEVHHGDCIGSDAEFHYIAVAMNLLVHVHPPNKDSKRAYCRNAYYSHEPKPYLVRDVDIVNASDVVIATPGTAEEQVRSGTWYTVRQARKFKRTIYVVLPSGQVQKEG